MAQQAHPRRGRGDALLEDPLPEQGIDEGALAGIELAHDHEQEQLVELRDRAGEGLLILGGQVKARQLHLQGPEQAPFLREERLLAGVEDGSEHPEGRGKASRPVYVFFPTVRAGAPSKRVVRRGGRDVGLDRSRQPTAEA